MNHEPNRDWLEDLLREEPRYVEDAGFSARVVAALPPARRRRRWLRPVVLGGMTVFGCVLAFLVLPGAEFITGCVLQLLTARSLGTSLILPALVLAGLVAAAFLPLATER